MRSEKKIRLSGPQRAALERAASGDLVAYSLSSGWRYSGEVRETTVKALKNLGMVQQMPAGWGRKDCPIVATDAGRAALAPEPAEPEGKHR